MESIKKSIDETTLHKREYDNRVNDIQQQMKERKVDSSTTLDASLVITKSSGTEFEKQNTSSRSGNDADANDENIRPIYDEEPMATVQTTAEYNVFVTAQQHAEQPGFNNKREVDQNAENVMTNFQHDFSKLEAHFINLELQLQNYVLKSGKHGQFWKAKSNEAKVNDGINVIETINIKLEHKVAKLLKENEHLKA
ncbi:hypothetical protein Tco_1556668 [Tanacetum coccineum]